MAKQSGVPLLIAHFPDFYGPHAPNTVLDYTLQGMIQNKKARYIGDPINSSRIYLYTRWCKSNS